MKADEATQRFRVPPRIHRRYQFEEAGTQWASPPQLSAVSPMQHDEDERHQEAHQQPRKSEDATHWQNQTQQNSQKLKYSIITRTK